MTISPPLDTASAFVRMISGAIAGGISSYILTQCSLRGVNFTELGVDSEIVKSSITGVIVGFVVTPKNLVYTIVDGILFVRFFLWNIWKAIRYGKQVDQQE